MAEGYIVRGVKPPHGLPQGEALKGDMSPFRKIGLTVPIQMLILPLTFVAQVLNCIWMA